MGESVFGLCIVDEFTLHGKCPVCGKGPLKPLALDYSVFVAKPDQTHRVGGLKAYQCAQELHVFFVMARDIDESQDRQSA